MLCQEPRYVTQPELVGSTHWPFIRDSCDVGIQCFDRLKKALRSCPRNQRAGRDQGVENIL
jgi:hypothetical protein